MKTPIFLLSLLLCAATSQAQTPPVAAENARPVPPARSEDAARPVEFGFNSDFERVQDHIVWTQVSDNGQNKTTFFVADVGEKGAPLLERIVFFDANNRSLATLQVSFNASGTIQKQELTDASNKPLSLAGRDMNALQIAGSNIAVRTVMRDGRLQQRVFDMDFPTWNGTLTSTYDGKGRRARDVFASSTSKQPSVVNYSYNERGLIKMVAENGDSQYRAEIQRNWKGDIIVYRVFGDGELKLASTPLDNDAGEVIGSRTERYDSGKLADALELRVQKIGEVFSTTITEIDGRGAVQERQMQVAGQTVFSEAFENGKLRQRVDFDKGGKPQIITTYKEDGTIESKKTIGPDGQLKDQKPAQN